MERLDRNNPMKKNNLELRALGADVQTYIREQLTSASSLSLRLAQRQVASVSAWLPKDLSDLQANDFKYGGSRSGRFVWVDEIDEAVLSSKDSIVVADGWMNRPSDPHLKMKQHFVTDAGEVYFYSSKEHPIDGECLVRWASLYPSVLCISSLEEIVNPNQVLETNALDFIAANARVIYLGVYDEETFLRIALL